MPLLISAFRCFGVSCAGQFDVRVEDRDGRLLCRQVLKKTLNWNARDIIYKRMFTEGTGFYPTLRYFVGLDNRGSGGPTQNRSTAWSPPDAGYPEDGMQTLENSEDYLGYFAEMGFDSGYRRAEVEPYLEERFDMIAVSMVAAFEAAVSSGEIENWKWSKLCQYPQVCGSAWSEVDPYGSSKYGQDARAKLNWESEAGFPWQQPTVYPVEAFGDGWDQWNGWMPTMHQDAWKSLWMPAGAVCILAYKGTGSVQWPYTATYSDPNWKLLISVRLRQPVRMVPGQRMNVNFKAYLGAD